MEQFQLKPTIFFGSDALAALEGLAQLVKDAGAELVGGGIVIEKAFQPGGDRLRAKGLRIEALARVQSMNEETGVTFADD